MKRWAIIIMLIAGAIFRIWGLNTDLPYTYYGDENYLIYNTLKFGTGDFNPHWFVWPTLFQYILFFLFGIYYAIGNIAGKFTSAADFLYLYLKDPTSIFLIARAVSALLGTASLYLIFLIGNKIYDFKTGFLSAVILLCLPLHVRYSHFAVTDNPMVFMMLLSAVFIVMIYQKGTFICYVSAGLFAGLATATKYPALILLVSITTAHFFRVKKEEITPCRFITDKRIIAAYFFLIAGFFVGCPFAILDHSKFLSDLTDVYRVNKLGFFGWENINAFSYHLSHSLKNTLGIYLFIFCFFGLIRVLFRKQKEEMIFLSLVVIYYIIMARSHTYYDRFMLPLLPFLSLFSARLIFEIKNSVTTTTSCQRDITSGIESKVRHAQLKPKLQVGRYAAFILPVLLLASPVIRSINNNINLTLPGTRALSKKWIESNIPQGSRILLNDFGLPLVATPQQVKSKFKLKPADELTYRYHQKRDLYYQIKEKIATEQKHYNLEYVYHPIAYLEGTAAYERSITASLEAIKGYQKKYDYIVIGDAAISKLLHYPIEAIPKRYRPMRDFYNAVRKLHPIKVFSPRKGIRKGPTVKIFAMK